MERYVLRQHGRFVAAAQSKPVLLAKMFAVSVSRRGAVWEVLVGRADGRPQARFVYAAADFSAAEAAGMAAADLDRWAVRQGYSLAMC